jgi:alpha-glucosidase
MKIAVRLTVLFVVLTSLFSVAHADFPIFDKVGTVQTLPNGVELGVGDSRVRITALNPNIIRIEYSAAGLNAPEDIFAVLPNSIAPTGTVRVSELPEAVTLNTGAVQVRVEKSPMRLVFLDASGQVISQDPPGHPVTFHDRAFTVYKSMPLDEHYFGLGDKSGAMDRREQAFTNWNTDAYGWVAGTDPLYKTIPFFIGMRGGKAYGIFLDNTYRSVFDFGKQTREVYSFGADGGPLDYYFMYGPDPKAVVQSFTALTGRTPLPPLFMLGYQQSRYSYFPEARLREVAKTFREHKIPCDVLYLDIDYQDERRPFTIDRKNYPNFEGMVHDLRQEGFKLVTITDLHIKKEPGYKPYDEGKKRDVFVKNPDGSDFVGSVWPGDSVFADFTRAEGRQFWGSLYADFVKMGIRGFWNDMNEPSIFLRLDKTMPLDTVHSIEGRKTDHREAHNIFGMQNARATYEGLLHLTPNERPFVLTRAAFAGTQRYAATWTGDNGSTWDHLRMTVPNLLSLGISGYPLSGADVGGFTGNPTPELLTRWTEVGAFQPFFRNHAAKETRDHEPWVDGLEHERIRRRYVEERYRLLPYIYSSMEETSRTGIPLMRPMFLEFPDEEKLETNETQYMFGRDLLVAPKVKETTGSYEVILPKGIWYDYWTGALVQGTSLKVDPSLSELPVYVRGGAIIPRQPLVQNADETPQGALELDVYSGSNCLGSLYTDDGNTFDYTRGKYSRQQFTCEAGGQGLTLHLIASEGSYPTWWKKIQVKIYGAQMPTTVSVDGKIEKNWRFDSNYKSVTLEVPATASAVTLNY